MANQYQQIDHESNLPPPQASTSIIRDSIVSSSIHSNGNTPQKEIAMESKKGQALCPWLLKTTVIFVLVFVEVSLIYSVLINPTSQQNGFNIFSDEMSTRSSVLITIKKFLASFTEMSPQAVFDEKHLTQYRKRLVLGQNMLKKFDDPSGSEVACAGVAKVMIQKALGDDQDGILHSAISTWNEEECRILSDAYLCVGEARLLLYTSSYSTDAMKRSQLLLAKESFEESVSLTQFICPNFSCIIFIFFT